MLRRTPASASIAFALSVFFASEAVATAQRTFVASSGNDANPCSVASPCRSFGAAIAQTNAGGEVIALDSAGYGPVVIAKSVSIIAPSGVYAGVSVISGTGITINGAAINVRLQGLSIGGQGGTIGIRFQQGASLHVEGCTVNGLAGDGISIEDVGNVAIVNTASSRNGGNGIVANAAAKVTIIDAQAELNSLDGIRIMGGASASIARATVTMNVQGGIVGRQDVAGTARVAVDSSLVSDNFFGVWALAEGDGLTNVVELDVARSTVARNSTSIFAQVAGTGSHTATISATSNQVVGNVTGLSGGSPTERIRATQNTITHNVNATQSAVFTFSPGNNYVQENVFPSGFTPDTLM